MDYFGFIEARGYSGQFHDTAFQNAIAAAIGRAGIVLQAFAHERRRRERYLSRR